MTFTDVDLNDHHVVSVTGVATSGVTSGLPGDSNVLGWLSLGELTDSTGSGTGGSDTWTFSAQDGNFDYLAAGETVTLTYTVQVDDGHGGIVTQPVTITVTGTNDTPVITSVPQAGAITELFNTTQPNPTGSSHRRHRNGNGDLHRRRPQRPPHGVGDRRCRFGHYLWPGEPWRRPRLADVRHVARHHGHRPRRLRRLDLLGAGQELRLSRVRRDSSR